MAEHQLTITKTPTNSSVPGFAYVGCLTDSQPSNLVLPSATPRYLLNGISYASTTSLTWAACASYCSSYQYASISSGSTCRCGNSFTFSPGISLDASCQTQCSGNTSQACGGSTRSTVFLNLGFGSSISAAGPSSSASSATPLQATIPQQPSSVVALASVVSRSSLSAVAASPIQLPTAIQLGPISQNLAVPVLGTSSLVPVLALPTSALLATALPSTSSTRSIVQVASAIALSAVPAQLVPVQSAAALSTPIFPALVPGAIVSSSVQGPTLPFATSQIPVPAPASPTPVLSSTRINFPLVVVPAVASLSTSQPAALSPNLIDQVAPIILASSSPSLAILPSAQPSTPALPAPISSLSASGVLAPTALLGLSSPPSPAVPSSSIVLGLLPPSIPTPDLTPSVLSGSGLINGPVLLPLVGAVTASSAALLNVPLLTGIPLVDTSSLLPLATPTQSSSSVMAVGSGAVGLLPPAVPLSQLLVTPAPQSVALPSEIVPPLTDALPLLAAVPFSVAQSPQATFASLLPAVPQLQNTPLTPAPAVPTSNPLVVGDIPPIIASAGSSVESVLPWWIVTESLEPHGLLSAPIFATPPPLALPVLPAVEEPSLPTPSIPSLVLASTSTNPVLGIIPAESVVPQVIESGTVIDKIFTWSLYADGSAEVNGTVLSPETGPIQAYLSDGTRIGMDSAGLYIGSEHRVPYPLEFLQVIRSYLLPPTQLLL